MAVRGKKDETSEATESETESAEVERGKSSEGDPLAALIAGLDEIVPGIEVLDRDLRFEGGARADLAAVDPSGRVHLVLLAGDEPDKAALETLDLVGVTRAQLDLLVRHLGADRANAERAPRVLVVSATSDVRLAERLGVLADAGITVLGLRVVKSAKGERAYLVRLDPTARLTSGGGGVAAFLRALPARLEPLGNTLVERMERVDEELAPTGDASTLVWRLGGEVLLRVERIGELLQASVAPRHEPMPLGDLGDLERVVGKAYGQLARLLGLARGEAVAAGPRPSPGRADEPILTPEEIEAFRQ
jgi:hypothetical protein